MKKDKKTDTQTLGGRLKGYEAEYESYIEPTKHIIIRIDGHHFSKYTKGLNKPYDNILSRAMIETTKDLLERFDAYTGYTQSDEITLFLPSLKDVTVDNRKKKTHKIHKRIREDWTHSFGGRTQKIASLAASFTTMSFNKHFTKLVREVDDDMMDDTYLWKVSEKVGNAYFDARVFGVDSDDEVVNSFLWRYRDCIKNSKSMFAQSVCSHKQLLNLTGEQQITKALEVSGKDWNDVKECYKYGVFVKKELYEKKIDKNTTTFHNRGITIETVTRSRIVEFSYKLTTFSEDGVKMIMSQYK